MNGVSRPGKGKAAFEAGTASAITVTHRPGSVWSQDDFGEAFDVGAVSVIGSLDPTGVNGVVEEVLAMFRESLDPLLEQLEHLRTLESTDGIRFEAHKLKSAAAQLGAVRLSAACAAILRHLDNGQAPQGETLNALIDTLVSETIRVQRRLRLLLQD